MDSDPRLACMGDQLSRHKTLAVAFSGGADSTLLLSIARDVVGAERVVALTAVTPYMVRQEIGEAVALADRIGVRHELVEMAMPAGLEMNPPDRCYLCKRVMYGLLREQAEALGFPVLLDASSMDDAEDARPSLSAVSELGVEIPFIRCGLDKEAIRALSRSRGLSTWRKPHNVCLLSRLRPNQRVSMECLQRIEEAERLLTARGYTWVRVRCHDAQVARIEVAADERRRLLAEADAIVAELRGLGFQFVSLDLLGYQRGSMN
ncbi:ATP-dependent sacrificial sulfur transferase LarE [Thiohalocapsa marina]|uniref:ATP-dependent sacrificial sulfur transferase LarE n=1 Tax=Thiohalocapsa marina TaxID=424902 RepID=A0A5M8FIT0_9GAMM|nr:ATP-dependent sacrificial sulfur transferase LarE [Thiohalocapsa marina]KAA6184848.1 ATP-dependent sacrificial sulfur transferase LarE [Thiohalocapsa marina]